jgi:hypothetical protein
MADENDIYPDESLHSDAVYDAVTDNCDFHSRQSEATLHNTLWRLPKPILEFVKKRVTIRWKQKNHVAILLTNHGKLPFTIVLDTKLENESMKVRIAILGLKIAEAYLHENPSLKTTREKLATKWGFDLSVLDNESIWGLTY